MTIYMIYSGGGYDFIGFKTTLSGAINFVRRRLEESKHPYNKEELITLQEFNEEYLRTGKEENYYGEIFSIQKEIELNDDDFKNLF